MRILISGGGTGGHVYPGITIAQALRDMHPGTEILFVGSENGLEADVIPREGFALETIPLAGLPRRLSPKILTAVWLAGRGLIQSRRILARFKPDVAIGTGGYVCGPVILASILAGVPAAIQEQNALPGLTNRLLGLLAERVFLGYEEASRFFIRRKAVVTGNPVRLSITAVDRVSGARRLGLDPSLTTLLVVGASQGARSINEALLKSLPSLLLQPQLQIFHITGPRNYDAVLEVLARLNLPPGMAGRIHTAAYLYNMPDAYAAADLVISRAGAISLAEMTARGLPLILVPFPYATGDHQMYNARALEKRGAARVIPDQELTSERLLAEVLPLLRDASALAGLRRASEAVGHPAAVRTIVTEIEKMAKLRMRRSSQ